ncbi:MAG: NAD(P)/FAD-dependent oxidoreductase, partial [Nitrososphaerota archaeon]
VVGAGFAGIETAGELIDFVLDARKYYPHIGKQDIRVIVLEALSNILPGFSEKLAKFAHKKLIQRGIDIRLDTAVTSFDGTEALVKSLVDRENKNIEAIQTKTLIWTAGVTPVDTIKNSIFKTEKGKMIVNKFLEIPDFSNVFAIGDCCQTIDPVTKRPYAPTAQLAEAHAKIAAHNLYALIRNKQKKNFEYKSKGQMAIIGKRSGIASVFGINVHGFLAWWLWRSVYLSKISRLEKRVRVLLDWTIDLFFDRDISRLKYLKRESSKEYKELDEVDDVW